MLLVCRLALALTIGCAVLVSVAHTIAGTQPAPILASLFTRPDGTPCQHPCLLGVRPEMRFKDAIAVLRVHPFIRQLRLTWVYGSTIRYTGPEVSVSLDTPHEKEDAPEMNSAELSSTATSQGEWLDIYSPIVLLGNVLASLGEPDKVYVEPDQVWLTYFDNQLLIRVRRLRGEDRLAADSVVTGVILTAEPGDFHIFSHARRWHGLASVQGYE